MYKHKIVQDDQDKERFLVFFTKNKVKKNWDYTAKWKKTENGISIILYYSEDHIWTHPGEKIVTLYDNYNEVRIEWVEGASFRKLDYSQLDCFHILIKVLNKISNL